MPELDGLIADGAVLAILHMPEVRDGTWSAD